MRLESLTINKFRHVKPCTLEFADDLSVVLGKNGAGKTTLLKLIAAVCKLDFSEFKEELSVDAVLRFGEWKIQLAIRKTKTLLQPWHSSKLNVRGFEPLKFTMNVRVAVSEKGAGPLEVQVGPSDYHHDETISSVDANRPLFLQAAEALVRESRAAHRPIPNSILENWAHAVIELTRFDESLDFFNSFTSLAYFSEREGHSHWIPEELLATWRKAVALEGSLKVGTDKDCALLRRWATYLSWTALSAIISLYGENEDVATYAGIKFVAETATRKVRHENFSYGQQRFLSFLYYAACQQHLLLVDELANGLHHEWIEICFAEMKGKQTIMSSQNPLIFDHLEFSDAAAVSKALILCSQNEQGEMVWENMHAESAAHFFTSYERGIRQVSEILREQKLW